MSNFEINLTDNSQLVENELSKQIKIALKAVGMQAEKYAKMKARVGTPESTGIEGYIGGTLRNSITHAISGEEPKIKTYKDNKGNKKGTYSGSAPNDNENQMSVYVGTNVEYAE